MEPVKATRSLLSFVCAVLCALILSSCQPGTSPTNSTTNSSAPGEVRQLAFVPNNASDFWVIARKGTEKAEKEIPGIRVDFRIPAEGTAADQQRIIDDLLAKGIDGIAISPVDPANQTAMLDRAASQAVIVTQDSDAPTSKRECYIGTDNVAAGRQAGELLKEALPNGGKVMVFVGTLDASNAQQRYQGLKEAINGSNIQILNVRTDNTDRVRAKANAADTLVNNPDIAGMVGLWSYNGPAIVSAVKEANKVDKVKIIAFDEEDETLSGVKDGSIYATVVQQPFEFGYQSIVMMAKVLNGDKSGIPASKQIFVPTLAVKRTDVDEFIKKINTLRGRS
jgi:ribose transport system substrate-binding protein